MMTPHKARRHVCEKPDAPASAYVWVFEHSKNIEETLEHFKAVAVADRDDGAVLWRVPLGHRTFNHVNAICRSRGLIGLCYGESAFAGGHVIELRPYQLERDVGTRHIEAFNKPTPEAPKACSVPLAGWIKAITGQSTRQCLAIRKELEQIAFEMSGMTVGPVMRERDVLMEYIGRKMVATRKEPRAYAYWAECERKLQNACQ